MSMSDGINPMTPEEHDAMRRMMERIANVGAGVMPTYHATESVEEAKAVVGQCMSATERLRQMLDERGVEWRNNDTIRWASEPHERSTIFDDANGNQVMVTQALSGNLAMNGRVGLTPEQAIEATLGAAKEPPTAVKVTLPSEWNACKPIPWVDVTMPNGDVTHLVPEATLGRDWLSYEGGTICINADKLPKAILVTEKDKRGREVYSARVHRFEERGECKVQEVYSGVGWVELQCSKCGCNRIDRHDNFCPNCGARVVEE